MFGTTLASSVLQNSAKCDKSIKVARRRARGNGARGDVVSYKGTRCRGSWSIVIVDSRLDYPGTVAVYQTQPCRTVLRTSLQAKGRTGRGSRAVRGRGIR